MVQGLGFRCWFWVGSVSGLRLRIWHCGSRFGCAIKKVSTVGSSVEAHSLLGCSSQQ